jgi:hypothetical protein
MSQTTFSTELTKFFEANGKVLIGESRETRKKLVKQLLGTDAPAWCERPSDVPTYFCTKKAVGFKVAENEKFRATRGNVSLHFDGKYWSTHVTLGAELADTDDGNAILADMNELTANGTTYYNVSTISSERRHCEALAKAVATFYKLAFSPISDVPAIDMKQLQTKQRRVEIYKYASKMVNEEPVAETPKVDLAKKPFVAPTVTEVPAPAKTEVKTHKKSKR